jgi:hypothetical protein
MGLALLLLSPIPLLWLLLLNRPIETQWVTLVTFIADLYFVEERRLPAAIALLILLGLPGLILVFKGLRR